MIKKFGADGDTTSWNVGRPAPRNWAAAKRTTDERRAAYRAPSEGSTVLRVYNYEDINIKGQGADDAQ
jgi:hypothetical protein